MGLYWIMKRVIIIIIIRIRGKVVVGSKKQHGLGLHFRLGVRMIYLMMGIDGESMGRKL